ncbi:MAG: type IV secretion system protein [Methylocystaceae bacterium]|nr:MAG: type IV secretion system protein [Methylocystaceae bacterium]
MKAAFTLLTLALAASLSGCASLTGAGAPSCDGAARRPLNRSLWDWESAKPIPAEPIEAPAEPLIRKGEVGRAPFIARAKPVFDIAASLRRCGGADHG